MPDIGEQTGLFYYACSAREAVAWPVRWRKDEGKDGPLAWSNRDIMFGFLFTKIFSSVFSLSWIDQLHFKWEYFAAGTVQNCTAIPPLIALSPCQKKVHAGPQHLGVSKLWKALLKALQQIPRLWRVIAGHNRQSLNQRSESVWDNLICHYGHFLVQWWSSRFTCGRSWIQALVYQIQISQAAGLSAHFHMDLYLQDGVPKGVALLQPFLMMSRRNGLLSHY